jgi:hypothetical protein
MIRKNLSFIDYVNLRAVNQSSLGTLKTCPELFKYFQENPRESTPAQDQGQVFHSLLLETDEFNSRYFCLPDLDRRTVKGKEMHAELLALNPGKIAVKADDFNAAHSMANSVRRNSYANKLLDGAETELSLDWKDPTTGVLCKARVDAYNKQLGILIDIKTTVDASPYGFPKKMFQYGYHRQAAWYLEAMQQNGERAEAFVFIAVEKTPPYLVGVYRISESTLRLSKAENEKLLRLYAECERTNTWPGYTQGVVDISIPDYATNALEELYGEPI